MGYHITIRRSEGELPISEVEFERACVQVGDLSFDAATGIAELHRAEKLVATLMHQDGVVWTSVAEDEVIAKMATLAAHLGARAYGDEEEWYSEHGTAHLSKEKEERQIDASRKAKRRRLMINVVRIAIVVAVVALVIINELRR